MDQRLMIVVLFALANSLMPARATSFKPPEIIIVSSQDGSALLRIDPIPGSETIEFHAQASVFSYDKALRSYRLEKLFPLKNPFYPARALIGNNGAFVVTLDDWPTMGTGANAIVLYSGIGALLKEWKLEDIFSAEEMSRMRRHLFSDGLIWRKEDVSIVDTKIGTLLMIGVPKEYGRGEWLYLNLTKRSFVTAADADLLKEHHGKSKPTSPP